MEIIPLGVSADKGEHVMSTIHVSITPDGEHRAFIVDLLTKCVESEINNGVLDGLGFHTSMLAADILRSMGEPVPAYTLSKRVMQEIARIGGQSRSARKQASSRRNGLSGGRPPKPLSTEQIKPI